MITTKKAILPLLTIETRDMKKVNILLSTYNGEEYLEEQLRSLLSQRGVETDILVRDDGSTDATHDILDRWQAAGHLTWYAGDNIGWAMSFIHLLSHAHDADYYAFCDQDDIWLPDKLSAATEQLIKAGDTPALYCSNMNYYCDGKDEGIVKPIGQRFNLFTAMVQCLALGCTMVLNKPLASTMKAHPPSSVIAHDFWAYQVASAIGTVYYDDRSFLLYRQHGNNQIGQVRSWREVWRRRLKTLRSISTQHDREQLARQLLACHSAEMSDTNRAIVEKVAHYNDSFLHRLRLAADRRYTMGHLSNDLWLRLRILIGKL